MPESVSVREEEAGGGEMTERCENCKWYHRLKHNFQTGEGFEESHACDLLLHMDKNSEGWIQEVEPGGMCEMFTEAGK